MFSFVNTYQYLYKQSRYRMLTLSLFYFFVDCVLVFRIVQMFLLYNNLYSDPSVMLIGDFSLVFDFLIGVTHTENLCCCIVALRDMETRMKYNKNLKSSTLRNIFYFCLGFWNTWAIF